MERPLLRLLILACSQRKDPAAGVLPAIDRYDGPAFRVLRKFLREYPDDALSVLILSAKYGLIDSAAAIPDYDCRMSAALADRLRPAVLDTLRKTLRSKKLRSVGLCVGKEYRGALDGMESMFLENGELEILSGGQGLRLTRLRHWLRAERR
jgi:hypothetical protein